MTLEFEMITSHVKTKDTVWVKYDLNNFYYAGLKSTYSQFYANKFLKVHK